MSHGVHPHREESLVREEPQLALVDLLAPAQSVEEEDHAPAERFCPRPLVDAQHGGPGQDEARRVEVHGPTPSSVKPQAMLLEKLYLIDRSPQLVRAWTEAFEPFDFVAVRVVHRAMRSA